jgi:ribosomal protein S18 acetylase RimI-like enzyme
MIAIRFAKPNEIKIARKIFRNAFRNEETKPFNYFLSFMTEDRIRQKEILLAFDGKKPVGFCSFYYKPIVFACAAYLDELAIIKDYQRRGVGKLLISKVLKILHAKGVRRIFSDTWPGNEASINLHKKMGFKYCGKITKSDGENADFIFFSRKP